MQAPVDHRHRAASHFGRPGLVPVGRHGIAQACLELGPGQISRHDLTLDERPEPDGVAIRRTVSIQLIAIFTSSGAQRVDISLAQVPGQPLGVAVVVGHRHDDGWSITSTESIDPTCHIDGTLAVALLAT
jgi:hypothetical protein